LKDATPETECNPKFRQSAGAGRAPDFLMALAGGFS